MTTLEAILIAALMEQFGDGLLIEIDLSGQVPEAWVSGTYFTSAFVAGGLILCSENGDLVWVPLPDLEGDQVVENPWPRF